MDITEYGNIGFIIANLATVSYVLLYILPIKIWKSLLQKNVQFIGGILKGEFHYYFEHFKIPSVFTYTMLD